MSLSPHVLVATLGGQPQVVTLTLDLLLRQGYPIRDVFVLHPRASSQPRLQRAFLRLNAEFTSDYYAHAQRTIHFHSRVLELDGKPIDDITDDSHADGTLNTIHQLIGDLKRQHYHIHLSVSGGRRLISLLAISVAALNFDRSDHIWHIYTPEPLKEQVREGACMHVPPEAGVKLIRGPFIALGAYLSHSGPSFRSTQEEQRLQMEAQERACCADVANKATPAQLKVLAAFARGLRPQQVANDLFITLATVNTHKTVLLTLCHSVWNVPLQERLDYHFLTAKFGSYFPDENYS
ncbi:MAG: CRISPR-associated ring nuclease [Ktedonobacteraceae bacterium]